MPDPPFYDPAWATHPFATATPHSFGVFLTSELASIGISRTDLMKAVGSGKLRKLTRGIYAQPNANTNVVRAISLDGRICCLSACKLYGLWVPYSTDLHVLALRNRISPKSSGLIVHSQENRPDQLVPSPLEAVKQVLRFHDAEEGLMVLDSALNKGFLQPAQIPALIRDLSERKQRILNRATGLAQSGLETRVRNFLISERVAVRPQVEIPTVGRVDMVAGESLILECNGDAFHSSKEQRNRDYLRIQNAKLLGYETVSLSYEQIFHRWEETKAYLRALIRMRKHLKKPVPLI